MAAFYSARTTRPRSRHGTRNTAKGNFELVVPAAGGGLVHYWRNNDDRHLPSSGPTRFGGGLGRVDAVAMIESNFGSLGNLEVAARVGPRLYAFWRHSQWHGPLLLETTMEAEWRAARDTGYA